MDEIDRHFQKYKDEAAEFSKKLSQMLRAKSRVSPTTAAQVNLTLAKTVFSKWSIEILTILYSVKSSSYSDLKNELRGITSRVLSEKLKKLEQGGLLSRTVLPGRPPRTTYSLTEKGLTVAKLGEPVFLYMAYKEGLYNEPKVAAEKSHW